ncbi:amidohydrolase family protein [Pseudohalioglobus sediminis]|uniref:Amidohydrolase family protein n=2 Tax=Pseudohalioglobus sediminis TaxID=2606449 RepID=A0A5B0X6J4_9GAMM|nr:amidohydrolase family protein [Pseudohalioglobus sediminis]
MFHMKTILSRLCVLLLIPLILMGCSGGVSAAPQGTVYDLVILGGRVIDPETGTDQVLNVGVMGHSIARVTSDRIEGKTTIDARGKIVSPGWIDMHHHSPFPFGVTNSTRDGVTTVLELEAGAMPVMSYGTRLEGKSTANFGASAGHPAARIQVIEGRETPYYEYGAMNTPAFTQKATAEQIAQMRQLLEKGLANGGIGIALLLDYMTNAVTDDELRMLFELAKEHNVPVFVHVRRYVNGDIRGLNEVLKWSQKIGAPLHVCHINANAMGNYGNWLAAIDEANANGADISTELFPYTAGSTSISSDVFGRDWQKIFNITYADVQWGDTGKYFESLDEFNSMRQEQPRGTVIHHYMKEESIRNILKYPGIIVATDAMPSYTREKKVVPNGIGSYTKVLTKYVRDEAWLGLSEAIALSTINPARRLENAAPAFKRKGRIQEGADADILVFDLAALETKASFEDPYQPSTGYSYVIVNGKIVIDHDKVTGTYSGTRILGRR